MRHTVKASETAKKHSDLDLDKLENEIPDLARIATREAYGNTIKSGLSIMKVIDGMLCEVFPNDTKK